ncbi:maleylpyruvate isomerase family mycothiol-dependent enzyme [Kibdelosporangium persicum]|uniref:Maleylpyruvate isomerase family mycothiol-dependent enzyme n=1 Tax=Kibdelosporangium persicum TaxID=2698649 RepID=A0ABX2F9Z3_9PSEU|nr:maleylpyruvate isomerase family mycothiol-dependent enzyme [Kibdelosporangium persicum]NRN68142.1 Maleylpyruvate isomerase family mycothiol-dependent enzyme [Kibdelosporangium persicum]
MSGKALFDQARLLDVLEIEATVLAETVDGAREDLRIPNCPGLTVGETARHVGSVYRMALEWMRTGDAPETWQRQPGPFQSSRDYVISGVRELVDELARHDPAEPCSTWWAADSTYGFWRRRMAHETVVHRMDVQAALDRPVGEIADDLAVDGVDEVLTLWFGHRLTVQGVVGARDGTVAVRTGGRAWLVRVTTGGVGAWRVPGSDIDRADIGRIDAEVTGPPANVYRYLWGRLGERAVTREGDFDAINQMWALMRLATR